MQYRACISDDIAGKVINKVNRDRYNMVDTAGS